MLCGVICGPTATGKSELAVRIARAGGFEVISADSRQVYEGLRVGTGRPTTVEMQGISHHLLGFWPPGRFFSAFDFRQRVLALLQERPATSFLVVGGTGFYLKALLFGMDGENPQVPAGVREQALRDLNSAGVDGIHQRLSRADPEAMAKIHPHDRYRVLRRLERMLAVEKYPENPLAGASAQERFPEVPVLVIARPRRELYERIDNRVREMFFAGWVEETKKVLMEYPGFCEAPGGNALGYREIGQHLAGQLSLEDCIAAIQKKTRNYAKRQIGFFRHQFPNATTVGFLEISQVLERVSFDWEACQKEFIRPIDFSHGRE